MAGKWNERNGTKVDKLRSSIIDTLEGLTSEYCLLLGVYQNVDTNERTSVFGFSPDRKQLHMALGNTGL